MKLLITGATGLVGSAIMSLCSQKNIFTHYLTTSKSKVKKTTKAQGFYWNPKTKEVDINCLRGIDAIINLAGASISKRWTTAYRNTIIESRVQSINLLYKLLSENEHEVKFVVSASAIGIYPSSFTEVYTETNTASNTSFLGTVVQLWEQEVDTLSNLGLSVCKLRLGIVLSSNGGALEKMTQPIGMGFGAALGNGKQGQSWIHINDLSRLFLHVIEKNLQGTYNAVASEVITNKELTKAISKQLHKPIWLPNIPAFLLKIILGKMASLVVESQRVSNAKILKTGFIFEYDSLEKALVECLG